MADSEHDEMYEDAKGSEDKRPKKTRKTAGGRVVIKSKEGAVVRAERRRLDGRGRAARRPDPAGDGRASGADSDAIRATNELSIVPFGVDTNGMIEGQGGSIHTLITVSHPNQTAMAALGHVTKDGGVSVLDATIIAESYISATARAMAIFGRAEERKHEQKKAG
eukprot:6653115-Prymnesium_polylepis.1